MFKKVAAIFLSIVVLLIVSGCASTEIELSLTDEEILINNINNISKQANHDVNQTDDKSGFEKEAIDWLNDNIDHIYDNNENIEKTIYYGYLLRYLSLHTNHNLDKLGEQAYQAVRYVYEKIDTVDTPRTKNEYQKLKEALKNNSYSNSDNSTISYSKSFSLKFGTLKSSNVTDNGNMLIIKAKINQSYDNRATILQNYYNVADIIKNQDGNTFDTIDYWAVADMTDGSESKVVSFTVHKDTINMVYNGKIADNQLGDFVDDLWILPSLR